MDISKWAFKNRNLVYFLVTVLFVGGILSCYQMSKLEDPEIKVKLAMVVTTYPGASAHQVELEVTDVLSQISAKYGKTPAQGAATAIHLALSDEAKDRNGCCYANCKKRNVSERIRHHAQQKQLWDDTEILLRQKGIRF